MIPNSSSYRVTQTTSAQKEDLAKIYSCWVHGHSIQFGRLNAEKATTSHRAAFTLGQQNQFEDVLKLLDDTAVGCLRLGWAARLVVWDTGSENKPKSCTFWCHYAIPTPAIEANVRANGETVLVNWESTDPLALSIASVHVWDGNRRIFADDQPPISDFDGGIDGYTFDPNVTPNLTQLYRGNIGGQPIYYGVGVSLQLKAHAAKDVYLEIRGVGVDFKIAA